jgi:hypothetical protein
MNTSKQYTDSQRRSFYYDQGQRVYADGGKDLGVPVPFTPTPTPKEDLEVTRPLRPLQSKHLELAKAIQDAGFVAEECGVRDDKLACVSPARDHGFSVALRSDHWFIWSWADRFYRGQGAARLQELCLLLLRNPPGVSTDSQHCSEYPLPKTIQDQFALEELERNDEGLEELWQGMREWLADRFGFRHYSDSEEGKSVGLPQAWAALNQAWGKSVPVQPEEVFVNDDLIYIPAPYYTIGGPGGFLFERRTGRGMTVEYPYPPDAVIWAYYHGFGWPDERRWGTVTIKAVRYPKWARSEVSTYERYDSTMRELARSFSNPPFVLRDVELTRRLALVLFRDKELLDCFDFEVVPTRTGAAPNGGPATQSDNSNATEGPPSAS